MFRLESERIKREFKITNGSFYASQVFNKYSGMSFVPDGNGSEFVIRFTDGSDFSAKGLPVVESSEENDRLVFVFEEYMGVTVRLEYWVHDDAKTICKQLTLSQSDDREIDFVFLDNIGIINSQTHLGVEIQESDMPDEWAILGQPFYIDSLFFGCEFPGADNRIVHGMGRVKYYIGKNVGKNFKCPVTVMGAAQDNTVADVKKAFFEYIDFIGTDISLRYQYNNWFHTMGKMNEASVLEDFDNISNALQAHGIPQLDAYVVDDGWCDYKGKFWNFSKKSFPNKLEPIAQKCYEMGSVPGLWLSPKGGYAKANKFAKKLQHAGNGYINPINGEICTASAKYIEMLGDFMAEATEAYKLGYWKLDGFWQSFCKDASHDHMTGGKSEMYLATDAIAKWVALLKKLRAGEYGKALWINLTCFVNPSPWWLQWVNSIWLQNSDDIGFSKTADEESRLDEAITYRDARYFDLLCRRNVQLPAKAIFNHEPIYAKGAEVNYTDEEFERYLYWCAVRGQALNEFYLSSDMMSDAKWKALKAVTDFQRAHFDILKNAAFIGGDPEDGNVYGFVSWSEQGEGIIALRNPDSEASPLTLTFNKLMGAPEGLSNARVKVICCASALETDGEYSYNDKLSFELAPFEMVILKLSE